MVFLFLDDALIEEGNEVVADVERSEVIGTSVEAIASGSDRVVAVENVTEGSTTVRLGEELKLGAEI